MAESTSWDQTELWRLLSKHKGEEADQVRTTLKVNLPTISQVLSSGATGAKDFTLHDEGHGRRVAERMPELVPASVLSKLSPYELAFLLLSAYLHDIGMVPTQRKVSTHYEYLLIGEASLLPPKELDEFQAYLTDLTPPVEAPLTSGPPTARQLRQAGKLTAYYCRHRHADWSADWIRANLAGQALGIYVTWVEDLVSLCKSHHWGYDELRSGRLDTRLIGPKSQVVNLRYLACVLRVADILEFDPERTPAIILEHRDVDAGSVVYWQKDHYPSIDRGPRAGLGPSDCCSTWVSSWASSLRPSTVAGAYCPAAKTTSWPSVHARAWTARADAAARASAWTRTRLKSWPKRASIKPRVPWSSGSPGEPSACWTCGGTWSGLRSCPCPQGPVGASAPPRPRAPARCSTPPPTSVAVRAGRDRGSAWACTLMAQGCLAVRHLSVTSASLASIVKNHPSEPGQCGIGRVRRKRAGVFGDVRAAAPESLGLAEGCRAQPCS
jgi:hypothetical protein